MLTQDELDDLFAAFGKVHSRPMFGGAGLYADGLMFAVDVGKGVFLKADDDLAAILEAKGGRRFTYLAKGRTVQLNFWSVPEEMWDAPEELAQLAHAALAFARREAERKLAVAKSSRRTMKGIRGHSE